MRSRPAGCTSPGQASTGALPRPGGDRVSAPVRPVRGDLICVGTLGRHKGQDLLVEALAELGDLDWRCVLAGPLDRDPDFVGQLRARINRLGYGHRGRLT